ncbi:MAG: arginine deiminase-related protein [Chloroflexota bacterium]|nr:arginine deiminase-related protein [Chloroflexota bacterium]
MTHRVLMCEPVHYRIDYEINPWMRRSNRVDGERALAQWRRLRERIEDLGVAVDLIEQAPEAPDMTFTANAGVVLGERFIPSNFRFEERQPEEDHFIRWFRQAQYTVETIHLPHYWEGEGDVLPTDDRVFAGYRYRTEFRALDHLEEVLGRYLVRVELADERFYHLDTCFAPLGDGSAMYVPDAFTAEGRGHIERHFDDLIAVAPEESLRFACNALVVDREVVMNTGCPETVRALRERGYEAVESATDEFIKAGGSVKCLTLMLDAFEPLVETRDE